MEAIRNEFGCALLVLSRFTLIASGVVPVSWLYRRTVPGWDGLRDFDDNRGQR
jgi:hypothetical protein